MHSKRCGSDAFEDNSAADNNEGLKIPSDELGRQEHAIPIIGYCADY